MFDIPIKKLHRNLILFCSPCAEFFSYKLLLIFFLQGLPVIPIWDDYKAAVTGMLTASDFILILREVWQVICLSHLISYVMETMMAYLFRM